ncbi:hypothetical protein [Candidatus Magnetaquicoccus inordinatus]|uniref:hypothetical protein n=1 Tax=Candidatus Magnetaquicoccus inordinatus TaxID=2496818 RepID=UPI00102B228D|nr:hypothetical protein [Candidatus Magnetaquicoccus inordinatus]
MSTIPNRFSGLWIIAFLLLLPGETASGQEGDHNPQPQEERTGEALQRARNALREAMDALSEAGRLTLDQQLPKLKSQTDQALRHTQQLLQQWENQLKQEMYKQKDPAPTPLPSPPDEGGKETPEETHQLQRI